jgi:hypothetical protein
MKISIQMPAYNAEATIAAALQSLLRQQGTGQFDIIVVGGPAIAAIGAVYSSGRGGGLRSSGPRYGIGGMYGRPHGPAPACGPIGNGIIENGT